MKFSAALHKRVIDQIHNRSFSKKLFQKAKSAFERHDKFTKQVVGLRRGKQFDFVTLKQKISLDKPVDKEEPEEVIDQGATTKSIVTSLTEDSSVNSSELSSVASLEDVTNTP